MIDNFTLTVHRLARESGEQQFRMRALALLRQAIPFDSGTWGTTRPDGIGVIPCSVELFEQTEALLNSYSAVRAYDRLGLKTTARPGETQIASWQDQYSGAHEAFRTHCETFNHFNIMSTMSKGALGLQHNFITLARGRASSAFDESERARMQQLLPHLMDAWIVNRSWHMKTAISEDQQQGVVSGICSAVGDLLGDHADFARLIANEFPGWSPPRLPALIMTALERQGSWRRNRLFVQPYPVADVVFLTARYSTEIDKLTAREKTIAREAAKGSSYKEIARSLSLSPATVRAHLHNIYGKLEISNKTALSRAISTGVGELSGNVPVRLENLVMAPGAGAIGSA